MNFTNMTTVVQSTMLANVTSGSSVGLTTIVPTTNAVNTTQLQLQIWANVDQSHLWDFRLNDLLAVAWYAVLILVVLVLTVWNFWCPVGKRWYKQVTAELLEKLIDIFKGAVLLFLFLTPGAMLYQFCNAPPSLNALGFTGWNLVYDYPCNPEYWAAAGIFVNADQARDLTAICVIDRLRGSYFFALYALITFWELATLVFFILSRRKLMERAVLSVSILVINAVGWAVIEIPTDFVVNPGTLAEFQCTIDTKVPMRAFACIYAIIATLVINNICFTRRYLEADLRRREMKKWDGVDEERPPSI